MKLSELEPKYLTFGDNPRAMLVFRCPHCLSEWLTCTSVAMSFREQASILAPHLKVTGPGSNVVTVKPFAWSFDQAESFETLTIMPSIDASAAGHWHGFITNGEARP